MQNTDLVFGPAVRRRYSIMLAAASFAAAVAPFALGLLAVRFLWPDGRGPGAFLVALLALAAAPAGTWLVHNRLGLGANAFMRRRLRERVAAAGHAFPEGIEPIFVGFSPGEVQLLWGGDTDRDIGFLAAWGDSLVYHGDEFSFHLPRANIDLIEPLQPVAGISRIRIRWHAPRESNRAFTLVSREAADLRGARRATRRLLNQLYAWVARPPQTDTEAPRLGMPPVNTSGGTPVDAAPGGSCPALLAIMTVTAVAAWQVGGPLVAAQKYSYAVLATGGIFALGFAVINSVFRLLQWAQERDAADRAASW